MSITIDSLQPIVAKHKQWLEDHSDFDEVRRILISTSDEIIKTIVQFLNDPIEIFFFYDCGDLPPHVCVWFEDTIHSELARHGGPMYSSVDFFEESREIVGGLDLTLQTLNRCSNVYYNSYDLAEIIYVNLQMGICNLLKNKYECNDEMSVDGLE